MITLHQAFDILREINIRMPMEEVVLTDSSRKILGEDVYSDMNMPPFDKSAMDGYACHYEDLGKALKTIGTLYAGSNKKFRIEPETCVKIMTGAPVPPGADTVIMSEDNAEEGNGSIRFLKSSTKRNICKQGEDVKKGDLVLKSGIYLLPLNHIEITEDIRSDGIKISSKVKTGVEMEALTAVSTSLLTIYDMCKAVDKNMVLSEIKLLEKKKV